MGLNQGFEKWYYFKKYSEGENIHTAQRELDRQLCSWLDKHHENPFFLYVHYIDPHAEYDAPEPYSKYFSNGFRGKVDTHCNDMRKNIGAITCNTRKRNHIISLYDEEIRYIDARFGELMEKLEQLKVRDKTLIIFISDHGEAFLEHGRVCHSNSVYAEEINVPLIIRYHELLKKGQVESYAQHIDIFPTVLHALNIDNKNLGLSGKNILDKNDNDNKIISAQLGNGKHFGRKQRSVISRGWKLVHDYDSEEDYLFDIKADLSDFNNLAKENSDITAQLTEYLSEWLNNLKNIEHPEKIKLNSEMKRTLKDLGYIK